MRFSASMKKGVMKKTALVIAVVQLLVCGFQISLVSASEEDVINEVLIATADASVCEGLPTNKNYSTSTTFRVSNQIPNYVSGDATGNNFGLIKFDASSLNIPANAVITSAILKGTSSDVAVGSTNSIICVYGMTYNEWPENATYNDIQQYLPVDTSDYTVNLLNDTGTSVLKNKLFSLDITSFAQQQLSRGDLLSVVLWSTPNGGIAVRSRDGSNAAYTMDGKPHLEISYYVPSTFQISQAEITNLRKQDDTVTTAFSEATEVDARIVYTNPNQQTAYIYPVFACYSAEGNMLSVKVSNTPVALAANTINGEAIITGVQILQTPLYDIDNISMFLWEGISKIKPLYKKVLKK